MAVVLPAPFGPQQPVDAARFDPEIDATERGDVAVALAQFFGLDCRLTRHA
jgi:hypothetical protein